MAGYYFRLPTAGELTDPQQAALYETGQIALSGGPGTGKSVVSLLRHISKCKQGKKSLLLTYTSTLARYLRACCATQDSDAAGNVGRSYKDKNRINGSWDEIIIDEAQDLPNDYYSTISKLSYGADDSQILYLNHCSKQIELKKMFNSNVDYVLDRNFRNTKQIMQFAKLAFPDAYIPQSQIDKCKDGPMPTILISDRNEWNYQLCKYNISNDKQDQSIIEIINTYRSDTANVAILVPSQSDAQAFEETLKKNNIKDFSIYYDDIDRFPNRCGDIKNVHITTFKSAKGLEFDTVIIPNFHKYPEICGKKYNIEWQDYYVAVTRARSSLFLISSYDMPQFKNVVEKSIISNEQTTNIQNIHPIPTPYITPSDEGDDLPF